MQTKRINDPKTGKKIFERTFLVKRALARGFNDEKLEFMTSMLAKDKEKDNVLPPKATFGQSTLGTEILRSEDDLMRILQEDIQDDICGKLRPLSSLNYVSVTAGFMILFTNIEKRLKELRNATWLRAYERDPAMMNAKRASLTMLAMKHEDKECLKVMAEEFEKFRANVVDFVYWEELNEKGDFEDPLKDLPDTGIGCVVM